MNDHTIAAAVHSRQAPAPAFGAVDGGFVFKPATKEQAKARIALTGPSGSGKTFTGLVTATALSDTVAVIDTERGSASKYAGPKGFQFDTLEMRRHDPSDLVKALAAAGHAGYGAVLIDSLSHFWSGIGGMLEQVDMASRRSPSGNTFAGWKDASPIERAMIDALVSYPGHVIVTMRVKSEWVIEENDRGKKQPRKVGLKPEQRAGIEYEFDVVGDLDQDNTMVISKTRCPELSGVVLRKPDASFAATVRMWLDDGVATVEVPELHKRAVDPAATFEELGELYREVQRRGLAGAAVMDTDGNPTVLGDLIKARGAVLRAGGPS